MEFKLHDLVIIQDSYFYDYRSQYHMDNKSERRPYYLAIKSENDIVWVIPLSSQVEKYALKIREDIQKKGECLFYYIARVLGKESVFLIGNVIPVHKKYVKRPFTVNGIPYSVENKRDIREIQRRVGKYIALVRQKKLHPHVNILKIEQLLLAHSESQLP